MRSMPAFALLLAGCAPMTDPSMGVPVTGAMFQEDIVGRVLTFRLPHGGLSEVQFQPDGTAVYSGPGHRRHRPVAAVGEWLLRLLSMAGRRAGSATPVQRQGRARWLSLL